MSLTLASIWWPAAAAFMVVALWIITRTSLLRRGGAASQARAPGVLEATVMVLLLVGGFLLVVGWLIGCVLLWVSPRWRWTDKLIGTVVWPGGLVPVWLAFGIAPALLSGTTGPASWLVFSAMVLLGAAGR